MGLCISSCWSAEHSCFFSFLFLILVFYIFPFRTRHQCLGLHQKKASNVCQKTWEDQGSSENDERCEFEFMVWEHSNEPDLEREGGAHWVAIAENSSHGMVVPWALEPDYLGSSSSSPRTKWMILSKLLNFSMPCFLICKKENNNNNLIIYMYERLSDRPTGW